MSCLLRFMLKIGLWIFSQVTEGETRRSSDRRIWWPKNILGSRSYSVYSARYWTIKVRSTFMGIYQIAFSIVTKYSCEFTTGDFFKIEHKYWKQLKVLRILNRSTRTIEENEAKWKQVPDTQLSIKPADNYFAWMHLRKASIKILGSSYRRLRIKPVLRNFKLSEIHNI